MKLFILIKNLIKAQIIISIIKSEGSQLVQHSAYDLYPVLRACIVSFIQLTGQVQVAVPAKVHMNAFDLAERLPDFVRDEVLYDCW